MRRTQTLRHRITLLLRRRSMSAASMTVCMARLESGCSVTVSMFLRRWRMSSRKAPMWSNMPCTFWFCSPSLVIAVILLLTLLRAFGRDSSSNQPTRRRRGLLSLRSVSSVHSDRNGSLALRLSIESEMFRRAYE